MKHNSTFVGKSIIALTLTFALITTGVKAQTSPNLKFIQPELVQGTAGEKNAVYKFSNVITGVNALIEIKDLKNGAYLVNIDDSVFGYYNAWQPTVGGPAIAGNNASIKWEIKFVTASGDKYTFPNMDMTAIDIDGDNVKVKEYIKVKGHSTFQIPVVTLMQLSTSTDDDNAVVLNGQGPLINRLDIDTMAMDVRVGYKFINKDKIEVTTGQVVEDNGYTGPTAQDRLNSLYFKYMIPLTVLPVTYRTFTATASDRTSILNWITEIEQGNDHFEVERSFDQASYRTIGIVLGAQSVTSLGKQYSFKDQSAELKGQAIAYYRLKQVDADGRFTYSAVKMVRFESESKTKVQVSPNPYMDKLNVNFMSETNGKGEVRMIRTSGQVVARIPQDVTKGFNNFQLSNLNSLSAGMYIIEINVDGKVIDRQKVVKQ